LLNGIAQLTASVKAPNHGAPYLREVLRGLLDEGLVNAGARALVVGARVRCGPPNGIEALAVQLAE
jgi:hypothetical protein